MKRVISTAFFRHDASAYEKPEAGEGRGRFFVNYLRSFVRAHLSVYPEWEWRIYHDERVTSYPYFATLQRLEKAGCLKLFYMGAARTLTGSMLWRMVPCWDQEVEIFACRDLDHLPTPRERRAVEEWIDSGKMAHCIFDSESHVGTRIMGGLCAFRTEPLRRFLDCPSFEEFERRFFKFNMDIHGADQRVLTALPLQQDHLFLHQPSTMPEALDPRDKCSGHARHCGGAFHVEPVVEWYDINAYTNPVILENEE